MPETVPDLHTRMLRTVTRLRVYGGSPLAVLLFVLVLPMGAIAQSAGSYGHPDEVRIIQSTAPNTGILTFKVFAERNGSQLSRQAIVRLVNLADQSTTVQATLDNSESRFTNIPYGDYSAEVSAVGYLSSHQDLKVSAIRSILNLEIVIRRDPSAVNFDIPDSMVSAQVRKETKRAISALKSNKLSDAQKHLDRARAAAPADPGVNFLLGYLYFQKKDLPQAATFLTTATNLNTGNAQALTLLGRVDLEQKDYLSAASTLERAIQVNAEDWLPHNLLADAYLHEKNYPRARDEAQIAIGKGRNDASASQLVLGEAFLNLGENEQGIRALQAFLQQSPSHPVAGQVRSLIAQVQEQTSSPTPRAAEVPQPKIQLSGVDPLLALSAPSLSMKTWQPPGIDEVRLAIAAGVSCPANLPEETGKRVQELTDNITKFAAVEDLFHQALDNYGTPVRTAKAQYNYVAAFSSTQPGILTIDEYRDSKTPLSGYPDKIATAGFVSLALVFYPNMRDSFTIQCEGLGDWHGQATWLVHFVQRDDRPNFMHSYKVGTVFHPVKLKGRAWITADTFQIVRMEAEMAAPMPEIQLVSEHQVVEYGPVSFQQKNLSLWLPKRAEIYLDFRKQRYYRRHSFDHYMLFSTATEEKRNEPVDPSEKK